MKIVLLKDPTTRAQPGASAPARSWKIEPSVPGTPPVEDITRRDLLIGAGGISSGGAKPKKPEAARERAS